MRTTFTFLLLLTAIFANAQKKINFHAETDTIALGDSVLLSWKIQDLNKVEHIRIKKVKDSLPPEGSLYVKPTQSMKYYLQVVLKNNKRKYTKRVVVNVVKPEIVDFRTTKTVNTDEDSTTIVWKTKNCDKILLNNKIPLKQSGELSFLFATDTVLSLTIYNKNNIKVERKLNIPIKKIEFIKGKHTIVRSDTLKLRWSFKDCKKVRIKGLNKKFKSADNEIIIPKKDTMLVFQVFRNNGKTTLSFFDVKVKPAVKKFYVSKYIYKNSTGIVKWNVLDGFRVRLDVGDSVITRQNGSLQIPPDTSKKYTLKVYSRNNEEVFHRTGKVSSIISPIKYFNVPSEAIVGVPNTIQWKVDKPFVVRIEGIGSNLANIGTMEIVPFVEVKYRLIASNPKGGDVDTLEKFMKVVKRRTFVNKVVDVKDMNKNDELNFEIFAIDESKYPDEVKLYIMAVDKHGNFIKGLTNYSKKKQKKLIKELVDISSGKKQKIKDFTFKEFQENISYPYDISLALDYSGSMYGQVSDLEKAVETFVKNKDDNDHVAVSRFDHRFINISDLETNKDSLLQRLSKNGMDSLGGGTALYAGGDFAMQANKGSKNNKVLILFTDGMENSSMTYYSQYAFSATTLAKKAKMAGVTIHVIGYGSGVNNNVLQKLAYTTGGNFYKLQSAGDINAVFRELPIIFKHFYVVTYKPVVKKGKHSVKMVYNNLQGQYVSVQTNYQVGDDFTISEVMPGYEDTYWVKAAQSVNKSPISVPQAIAFFDFNKTDLKNRYKKSLETYITFLNSDKNSSIIIMGHTDMKGTDKYCEELGLKRAETIKKYFESKGIDGSRVHTFSYGKSEPIWYPEDAKWKADENRRIELLIVN